MCTYRDIFQAKLYDILDYINQVKTHTNDRIIQNKVTFECHIDNLRVIFSISWE